MVWNTVDRKIEDSDAPLAADETWIINSTTSIWLLGEVCCDNGQKRAKVQMRQKTFFIEMEPRANRTWSHSE